MNTGFINNYEEYKSLIERINNVVWLKGNCYEVFYRGQSNLRYTLLPEIVRKEISIETIKKKEMLVLNAYKKLIIEDPTLYQDINLFLDTKYKEEWYLLFQAKHIGLKSILLDWTIDSDVALLFALENKEKDGAFYVFSCPKENIYSNDNRRTLFNTHPKDIEEWCFINPPYYADNMQNKVSETRRLIQDGRFSMLPYKNILNPLEENEKATQYISKYLIPKEVKTTILDVLSEKGYCLSNYINNDQISEDSQNIIKQINNL